MMRGEMLLLLVSGVMITLTGAVTSVPVSISSILGPWATLVLTVVAVVVVMVVLLLVLARLSPLPGASVSVRGGGPTLEAGG